MILVGTIVDSQGNPIDFGMLATGANFVFVKGRDDSMLAVIIFKSP